MGKIFNPPPNWPAPPPGWQPPSGWQPDAAWGPAPEGWRLWVRANAHPFRNSAAAGGIAYLVLLILVGAAGRLTAEVAGRLFSDAFFPALLVGFIARQSSTRWRWWLYALAVTGGVLVVFLLTAASALQGTTR